MIFEFELPLQGLSEGLPVENQPANTTGHISNVRPIDVLEKRVRLGQRPGLDEAYSQQIGGAASPIMWIGDITVATGGLAESEKDYYKTNDDEIVGITNPNDYCGQSFTASSTYYVTSVKIKCLRLNNPGNITIELKATDEDGLPTGPVLATLTVADTTVPSYPSVAWVRFQFDSPVQITSGTKYTVYMRCASPSATKYIHIRTDKSSPTYTGGNLISSSDSGSNWSNTTAIDLMFAICGQAAPIAEQQYEKKLLAVGNNEFWYESSLGTIMSELSAANGEIDTTLLLNAVRAYQKIFIANRTNLKIADFVNIKISTDDAGANPCTKGMTLTGGTSGAELVVDYVDGVTDDAAANIYGYRTSISVFVSGETITGTNADGNTVSFDLSANETTPPHWYDWTVFGNDTTNYGTMPESSTLICLYRGRIVINDTKRPQAWYMSKVGNPFKFLYDYTNDGDLSAVTFSNTLVGEIGDIITALIPYKDDLLIFGCANSIWILIGDPLSSGQIAKITDTTGIWGGRAWCIDNLGNLYFLGSDGIYKVPISETISQPANLSKLTLPNLMSDLDLDESLHRVVLTFDPVKNGIIISKTLLSDGTNSNYWFDLTVKGFFPEIYPEECGIFSSFYYKATDDTYTKVLLGCQDGYIREFLTTAKDDDAGDSDEAISSYLVLPIKMITEDEDKEGKLLWLNGITAGGASGGDFSDSDSVEWSLYVGDDAETALEDIKDGATAFVTGTWSGSGKHNKTRVRARGTYIGFKLANSTESETWAINKIFGNAKSVGRLR